MQCEICLAPVKLIVDETDPTRRLKVDPLPYLAACRWVRGGVAVRPVPVKRADRRRAPAVELRGYRLEYSPAPDSYRVYPSHDALCRQIRPDAWPDTDPPPLPFEPAGGDLTRERRP